jgi:hypothetical protein
VCPFGSENFAADVLLGRIFLFGGDVVREGRELAVARWDN